MSNHQQNLPAFEKAISDKANRIGIADRFEGDSLQRMVSLDVDLIDFYDKQIQRLDLFLEQHAKLDDPDTFFRLQSIPGVGRILAMRMLYEIHDIKRFPAERIEKKHNKARANTLLAIKLGRAVYWMWKRKAAFNPNVFAKD